MSWIEVLVEGSSDVPAVREILTRKFFLVEDEHFIIHSHKGRGNLPSRVLKTPDHHIRSLLNQLPSKLRGYSTWMTANDWVLVVVDADDTPSDELLRDLQAMLNSLPKRPRVLFCIAIEETESWFIADLVAFKESYPKADCKELKKIPLDSICGAWERLAEALKIKWKHLDWREIGTLKTEWALQIAPHLDFENPPSPSLKRLIDDIRLELDKGLTP